MIPSVIFCKNSLAFDFDLAIDCGRIQFYNGNK